MTWAFLVLLISSMMQAKVVLFPLPAGPVTRTRPLVIFEISITFLGRLRVWKSGSSNRTIRMIAAREPLWRITLARNRDKPLIAKEKSSSPPSSTLSISRCPAIS